MCLIVKLLYVFFLLFQNLLIFKPIQQQKLQTFNEKIRQFGISNPILTQQPQRSHFLQQQQWYQQQRLQQQDKWQQQQAPQQWPLQISSLQMSIAPQQQEQEENNKWLSQQQKIVEKSKHQLQQPQQQSNLNYFMNFKV